MTSMVRRWRVERLRAARTTAATVAKRASGRWRKRAISERMDRAQHRHHLARWATKRAAGAIALRLWRLTARSSAGLAGRRRSAPAGADRAFALPGRASAGASGAFRFRAPARTAATPGASRMAEPSARTRSAPHWQSGWRITILDRRAGEPGGIGERQSGGGDDDHDEHHDGDDPRRRTLHPAAREATAVRRARAEQPVKHRHAHRRRRVSEPPVGSDQPCRDG